MPQCQKTLDANVQSIIFGFIYQDGNGVEKNEKKAAYHSEKDAIGGHAVARHNLGVIEGKAISCHRMFFTQHLSIAQRLFPNNQLARYVR